MLDVDALAEMMAGLIDEQVSMATAPLLERIRTLEDRGAIQGPAGEKGEPGEPGADGKDGRDGEPGRDGQDGRDGHDGKDGEPGVKGIDGKDGRDGCDGTDGVGLAGAMINRAGEVVITLSNGTAHNLGPVVGKDGRDGRDGADGLGFEHMEEEIEDGGRILVRRYRRGDEVKEFRHVTAQPVYRGVFSEGREYLPGDMTTWAGSIWHCEKATKSKPDNADSGFQLAVKRGRDGKDFKPKEA